MIDIDFYNFTGRRNTVNKALGVPVTLRGTLKQDYDILQPVIAVRLEDAPSYNYCYVPAFGRYYFVDRVTVLDAVTYELRLAVDCLKTYEEAILDAAVNVETKDNADKYISNRRSVYDTRPKFETVGFPNTGLFTENGNIVMVTVKGTGGN